MRRLLAACLLALPLLAYAAPRTCRVVGISDGDTFTALCDNGIRQEQIRVRFNAIDAPERQQAFGTRARQALSQLIFGKEVDLDCPKTDPYGRSVCRVMVAPNSAPDGPRTLDAGLAMLTIGMAWWYRAYAGEQTPQERGQYEFAEQEARAKRAGLWRDADPMPPWQWRQARRTKPQGVN
ncbi:thermonuclease family protein [Variovorax sp. J22P168]|nr:thermonuclease family protein [Variovorax sp. J22P168]MDM0013551.1 thermonuclease family protein [Variovorax sp. J22P168]